MTNVDILQELKQDQLADKRQLIPVNQIRKELWGVIKWPKKGEGKLYSSIELAIELKKRGFKDYTESTQTLGMFLTSDGYWKTPTYDTQWNVAFVADNGVKPPPHRITDLPEIDLNEPVAECLCSPILYSKCRFYGKTCFGVDCKN